MNKEDSDTSNNAGQKILLLIIDKCVLGIALAAVAYFFNVQLQNSQFTADYQKYLFENRLRSYQSLLQSARQARDECLILHTPDEGFYIENPEALESEDISWKVRIQEAQYKAEQLDSDENWSRSFSLLNFDKLFKSLEDFENVRRENAVFLSDAANKAADQFLNSLMTDVEEQIQRHAQKKYSDKAFASSAAKRTQTAYEKLRKTISDILRVDEVILG